MTARAQAADGHHRPKALVSAIHDVGPRSWERVQALQALMGRHVDPARIAMLVVPDHWGEAPIRPGTEFATWLRGWAQAGAEIFLHGWFHRDDASHSGRMARLKAQHMTAGEGEFLGLDHATCVERMRAGRALLEDITGLPVAGFVAPAWLYGPDALAALREERFALAEDHMKVWRPESGEVIRAGPVITWASRSRGRIASSLAAAWALPTLLTGASVVRLATHPGDMGVPALVGSIDRTLRRLVSARKQLRYGEL